MNHVPDDDLVASDARHVFWRQLCTPMLTLSFLGDVMSLAYHQFSLGVFRADRPFIGAPQSGKCFHTWGVF